MTTNEQLNRIIFENFTIDQRNKLEALLESDSKFTVMKKFLDKILQPIKTKITTIVNTSKVDDVILQSKGDIDKIKGVEYGDRVNKLLMDLKGNKEISDLAKQINTLRTYIKNHTKYWKKAYTAMMNGSDGGYLLYSTYSLHIHIYEKAIALLLACYISTRSPKKIEFFSEIFNSVLDDYKKGSITKYCSTVLEEKTKPVKEDFGVIGGSMIVIGIIIAFAFALRMLVFYVYYSRTQLSDYFEQQATFLKLHATEVKKRKDLSPEEKKAILESQKKWAERLMTLSELISVDSIQAMKQAKEEHSAVNKDINPDIINNTINDGNEQQIDFF